VKSPRRVRKWFRVGLTGTRRGRRSSSPSMPRTPSRSCATWRPTAPRSAAGSFCRGISVIETAELRIVLFSKIHVYLSFVLQLDIHVTFEGEKEFVQKISLWGVSKRMFSRSFMDHNTRIYLVPRPPYCNITHFQGRFISLFDLLQISTGVCFAVLIKYD